MAEESTEVPRELTGKSCARGFPPASGLRRAVHPGRGLQVKPSLAPQVGVRLGGFPEAPKSLLQFASKPKCGEAGAQAWPPAVTRGSRLAEGEDCLGLGSSVGEENPSSARPTAPNSGKSGETQHKTSASVQ